MTKKIIASCLIVASALVATRLFASPSPKQVLGIMAFAPANAANWKHDDEATIAYVEADHFLYKGSDLIDLNVIRDDNSFDKDLAIKGKDAVVEGVIEAQNKINQMFSVGRTELTESRLEHEDQLQVLTLSSQQDLPDGRVQRIEKYFIAPGQTLHAELRWHLNADAAAIAEAKKEFADARFEVKER